MYKNSEPTKEPSKEIGKGRSEKNNKNNKGESKWTDYIWSG